MNFINADRTQLGDFIGNVAHVGWFIGFAAIRGWRQVGGISFNEKAVDRTLLRHVLDDRGVLEGDDAGER